MDPGSERYLTALAMSLRASVKPGRSLPVAARSVLICQGQQEERHGVRLPAEHVVTEHAVVFQPGSWPALKAGVLRACT
jgi:hypothetical protein